MEHDDFRYMRFAVGDMVIATGFKQLPVLGQINHINPGNGLVMVKLCRPHHYYCDQLNFDIDQLHPATVVDEIANLGKTGP